MFFSSVLDEIKTEVETKASCMGITFAEQEMAHKSQQTKYDQAIDWYSRHGSALVLSVYVVLFPSHVHASYVETATTTEKFSSLLAPLLLLPHTVLSTDTPDPIAMRPTSHK